MENFLILVSIASLILSIVLIVKFWVMCNNVKRVADRLEDKHITVNELIYLSKTNDPSFEAKLQRRIYLDFYSVYDNTTDLSFESMYNLSFESIYNMWQKRCDYYKWEFPELFAKVKTYDDFRQFLREYSDVK